VLDLFGDYVRYQGGELRMKSLLAMTDVFGVNESTTRMVAARMRREGWFEARPVGRETTYVLTDKALRVLNAGRERIFRRSAEPWESQWHMVIYTVPESDRPTRDRLRKGLSWLGFGPLAPSTWISPHDRLGQVAEMFADVDTNVRLDLLTMGTQGLPQDRELAARCWDLEALNKDYQRFVRHYLARLPDYRAGLVTGPAALRERMQLVHDYRLFPFRDPDLPLELLPPGWVGREVHDVFLEVHDLLREPAEQFYRQVTGAAE
jgi:phenylacetic acid degradation operon negative regulatory protein